MSDIAVNEQEHRRGLVLGLTLAEVLLLLLFLLMLALGARLQQVERELDFFDPLRAQLGIAGQMSEADLSTLLSTAAEADQLREANVRLTSELAAVKTLLPNGTIGELLADPASAEALEKAIAMAAAIDPNDPPARLQRAMEILNRLGPETLPADVPSLNEVIGGAARVETLEAELAEAKGHQWPPIISLSEADGYSFGIGSAALSPDFETLLYDTAVPKLLKIVAEYEVDVIEVIGHTDEQAIAGRASNLDTGLIPVLSGAAPLASLIPADNAGLGLARAAAVAHLLASDDRLDGLRILPLSGAQLILTNGTLSDGSAAGDVPQRRRIELRMRRSDP